MFVSRLTDTQDCRVVKPRVIRNSRPKRVRSGEASRHRHQPASQSRFSRRGGRCLLRSSSLTFVRASPRFASLIKTNGLSPLVSRDTLCQRVGVTTSRATQINQVFSTRLCEQVVGLRNSGSARGKLLRTCGASSLCVCFFCCHAAVSRTRFGKSNVYYSIEDRRFCLERRILSRVGLTIGGFAT